MIFLAFFVRFAVQSFCLAFIGESRRTFTGKHMTAFNLAARGQGGAAFITSE